jgi:hypothetical protein
VVGQPIYVRNGLPRASADRFVDRHETSLTPETKRLSEAIPETTAEDVQRLVRSLMPRLRRVLTTPSWVEWFLTEVAFQMETADASPAAGKLDEVGAVATGDSGDQSEAEAAPLAQAA